MAFEDCGREGAECSLSPEAGIWGHTPRVPREREEPVLGQDLQADIRAPLASVPERFLFYFIIFGGWGGESWENSAEATGAQKACRDLNPSRRCLLPRVSRRPQL